MKQNPARMTAWVERWAYIGTDCAKKTRTKGIRCRESSSCATGSSYSSEFSCYSAARLDWRLGGRFTFVHMYLYIIELENNKYGAINSKNAISAESWRMRPNTKIISSCKYSVRKDWIWTYFVYNIEFLCLFVLVFPFVCAPVSINVCILAVSYEHDAKSLADPHTHTHSLCLSLILQSEKCSINPMRCSSQESLPHQIILHTKRTQSQTEIPKCLSCPLYIGAVRIFFVASLRNPRNVQLKFTMRSRPNRIHVSNASTELCVWQRLRLH